MHFTDLERKVKAMYRAVATQPMGEFHFELGRTLAERLGYPVKQLDAIPVASIDSFAGVDYHFDLAALRAGEQVVDLGSGSGMDTFVAALEVGHSGRVTGMDMTDEQLAKAEGLRAEASVSNLEYRKAYIEVTGLASESFDAVINNGRGQLGGGQAGGFPRGGEAAPPRRATRPCRHRD